MKNDIITCLPIVPMEHDIEWYNKLDYSTIHCKMAEEERKFINGLIRYYQPSSLLEVGVLFGGGTCNLLNAISDNKDALLTSIDINEENECAWGENAKRLFPEYVGTKWRPIAGKDPCEVLHNSQEMYDFAIIDTAHRHPIESLNFLTILPYLKDGAVVVLHDIENHYEDPKLNAACILWSCVVAPKITPPKSYCFNGVKGAHKVINIGAFQVTSDTREHIKNVFYSLSLPWNIPWSIKFRIKEITKFFEEHYEVSLLQKWKRFYGMALTKQITNSTTYNLETLKSSICYLRDNVNLIFFGAGGNMSRILYTLDVLDIEFDYPIWDEQAEKIKTISGHKVQYPDYSTPATISQVVVITILDRTSANAVGFTLRELGFQVIHSPKFFELCAKRHIVSSLVSLL